VWQDRYGIAVPIESCSIYSPSTAGELVAIQYAGDAGEIDPVISGLD